MVSLSLSLSLSLSRSCSLALSLSLSLCDTWRGGGSKRVHSGSVSVMERHAQIVREMVHTHFNSAVHTSSLNP